MIGFRDWGRVETLVPLYVLKLKKNEPKVHTRCLIFLLFEGLTYLVFYFCEQTPQICLGYFETLNYTLNIQSFECYIL